MTLNEREVLLVRDLLDGALEYLRDVGFDDEKIQEIVAARLRFIGHPGLRLVEEENQ